MLAVWNSTIHIHIITVNYYKTCFILLFSCSYSINIILSFVPSYFVDIQLNIKLFLRNIKMNKKRSCVQSSLPGFQILKVAELYIQLIN